MTDLDHILKTAKQETTPGGIVLLTTPEPAPAPEPPVDPTIPAELKDGMCPICGSDSPNEHERTCMASGNAAHCSDCGWFGVDDNMMGIHKGGIRKVTK
jgi:hypothetical protein